MSYYNINITNVWNSNLTFYFRGDTEGGPKNASVMRINNEGQSAATSVELKTPGGAFTIATEAVIANEMHDIMAFHAIYDVHVSRNDKTVVIRSVEMTEGIEFDIAKIFANDFSGIPIASSPKVIGANAKASDYLSAGVLEDIGKVTAISQDDNLANVFAKLQAASNEKKA